jgi:hypothetical protein
MPAKPHPATILARGLVALLGLAAIPPAAAQATDWATASYRPADFVQFERMVAAARDASGNLATVSQCVVAGRSGACISRVDTATGSFLWTRFQQWGADEGEADIAVSAGGDVHVIQRCTSAGLYGYCVAKLQASDGAPVWYAAVDVGDPHFGDARIALDGSGNVIVAGICPINGGLDYAPCVRKLNAANGTQAWAAQPDWGDMHAVHDDIAGLAVDGSGNVFLAGTCRVGAGSNAFYSNMCVEKLSGATGATAWQATINGTSSDSDDKARHLAILPTGAVIAGGSCNGGSCVARLDNATGATQWFRALPAAMSGVVRVRHDGVAHVLALSSCTNGGTGADICVDRLDVANGNTLWSASHSGPGTFTDTPADLVADGAGFAYVAGTCGASGPPSSLFCIFKLDVSTGGKPWIAYHAAPSSSANAARAIQLDAAGNPVTAGSCTIDSVTYACFVENAAANAAAAWSFENYSFLPTETRYPRDSARPTAPIARNGGFLYSVASCGNDGYDLCLTRTAESTGATAWTVTYRGLGGVPVAFPAGIAFASNGDPIVGASCSASDGKVELCAIRFAAANGAVAWTGRYSPPGGGDSLARAIATGPTGTAYVTGECHTAAGNNDMCTAAFNAADGSVAWSQLRNGTQNAGDEGVSVLYLPNGVVAATGRCTNTGTNSDICTTLYNAATGAVIWNATYGLPGSGRDEPRAMATDNFFLYVAGQCDAGGQDDFCTLKISLTDGSLAWARSFASTGGMDDEPAAIAVGPDGNPVVFGTCYPLANSRESGDLCTLKLAASTGNTLWMSRYLTGRTNVASAGTIDPEGNPVIAGECAPNLTGRIDLCAIKYAGSNGAQRWMVSADASARGYAAARGVLAAPGFLLLAGEHQFRWEPAGVRLFRVANAASAPSVVSVTRVSPNPSSVTPLVYEVTFSEAVTGVDSADFSVTVTGSVTGAAATVLSGSGTTWLVAVSRTGGQGTLRLNVVDNDSIVDAEGNPLNGLGVSVPYTAGESFTVHPPVTITTTTLPSAIQGTPYSQVITATAGIAPYTFSVLSGTLPAGLSLAANGTLSGTPTAAGVANFTVQAGDSGGSADTQSLPLTVLSSTYPVSVTVSGSGTVNSSPTGIACGAACSAPFATGSTVSLGAVPAPGFNFAGWSGACTGTGTCVVVVDGEKSVTATFSPASFDLSVSLSGAGLGAKVLSAPAGIDCPGACTVPFPNGQVVALTPSATDPRLVFTHWSGACTGSGACQVTMSQARSVTAHFTYLILLPVYNEGGGTIVSSPAGISCGPGESECEAAFLPGTSVTLTATALPGGQVSSLTGSACTGEPVCEVTVTASDEDQSANMLTRHVAFLTPLTVTKSGAGSGTVATAPATSLDCGATCTIARAPGTPLTLVASASPGSTFTGWSGGGCSGTGTCEVTFTTAAQTVVATFAAAASTRGDVNGDGKADLFWRTAAPGQGLSWWTMNGAVATAANYHDVDAAWQIADVGDLDGDGKADLVWRRTTDGASYLWLLDGFAFKGFADLGVLDPAVWSLVGTGDLDGDGKDDIVWRGTDGTVYAWLMNGGVIASQGVISNPGAVWVIADLADMDGDGKADIVFRNATDGGVYIYFMNGLSIASGGFVGAVDPATWTLVGAADFSGDGKADFLWRHNSGDTWVWLMNGASFVSAGGIGNPGAGWSVRAFGDFDGDGKYDLVWRHTDGTTYLWRMNGLTVSAFDSVANPGGSWQIVAP